MRKRVLAINFGGIGDQILFFPTLKTLKKTFDNSHITFVTEPRSGSVNQLTDLIDEVFICDLKTNNVNAFKLLWKAFWGKYDIVISSGSSKLVAILLFLTGIKKRIGYDSGALSQILLTQAVPLNKEQYAVNMYHDLASEENPKLPEVKIDIEHDRKSYIENLIYSDMPKKKVVIHPGVSKLSIEKGIIKFWSAKNWATLIRKLVQSEEYRVILTGGTDDREIYSEIFADECSHYKNVGGIGLPPYYENLIDLSKESFSIKEFAYIVKLSDMLVCVDSAPMHIAVGLNKPVVALFGPTDDKKLLPENNKLFTAVKNDKARCRPCLWKKRQTSCKKLTCLNIEPEKVLNIIKNFLQIAS